MFNTRAVSISCYWSTIGGVLVFDGRVTFGNGRVARVSSAAMRAERVCRVCAADRPKKTAFPSPPLLLPTEYDRPTKRYRGYFFVRGGLRCRCISLPTLSRVFLSTGRRRSQHSMFRGFFSPAKLLTHFFSGTIGV